MIAETVLRLPRSAAQLLIVVYQRTISLDHGPLAKYQRYQMCRFHPTCSEYGYEAIGRFGVLFGSWMTFKRLLRCNPWNVGGEDPVPKE